MILLNEDRRPLIEPHHPSLSIREQSELLQLNRSSYYYEPAPLDDATLNLMKVVDEIYMEHPFFGTRQMANYLNSIGYDVGREKMRGIYHRLGLQAACPGPHTSKPHPGHKKYPYLLRNVEISHCNHVWSSDITYLPMKKGFLYLVAIIDWYSRFVLDWELSITLESQFCVDTLTRALTNSHCEIFNTDQGSQFTSSAFTSTLLNKHIKISMDGKGRALDNVFVERLWRSVKYECVYLYEWATPREIRHALKEYFHFYNYKRPHQGLKGKTPASIYLH